LGDALDHPALAGAVAALDVLRHEQVTGDPNRAVVRPERTAFHVPFHVRVAVEPRVPGNGETTVDVDLGVRTDAKVAVDRAEADPPVAGDSGFRHRAGQGTPLV
jgi:hypothetical protein